MKIIYSMIKLSFFLATNCITYKSKKPYNASWKVITKSRTVPSLGWSAWTGWANHFKHEFGPVSLTNSTISLTQQTVKHYLYKRLFTCVTSGPFRVPITKTPPTYPLCSITFSLFSNLLQLFPPPLFYPSESLPPNSLLQLFPFIPSQ